MFRLREESAGVGPGRTETLRVCAAVKTTSIFVLPDAVSELSAVRGEGGVGAVGGGQGNGDEGVPLVWGEVGGLVFETLAPLSDALV